ncbi:hypothetical protein SLOPH_802, partial [Spraguea lophii 42_110]
IINIDIYDFLVSEAFKYFYNTRKMFDKIKNIKKIIEIKINNKNSHYPINIEISPLLSGDKRILKYEMKIFLLKLIEKIKMEAMKIEKEEAYLHLMNFTSELALSELIDLETIENLKIFISKILN